MEKNSFDHAEQNAEKWKGLNKIQNLNSVPVDQIKWGNEYLRYMSCSNHVDVTNSTLSRGVARQNHHVSGELLGKHPPIRRITILRLGSVCGIVNSNHTIRQGVEDRFTDVNIIFGIGFRRWLRIHQRPERSRRNGFGIWCGWETKESREKGKSACSSESEEGFGIGLNFGLGRLNQQSDSGELGMSHLASHKQQRNFTDLIIRFRYASTLPTRQVSFQTVWFSERVLYTCIISIHTPQWW